MVEATPDPVKRVPRRANAAHAPYCAAFAAVLAADPDHLDRAEHALRERFGEPLLATSPFPFHFTAYYVPETGPGALKRFLVYPPAPEPPALSDWKRWARTFERGLAAGNPAGLRRPVNLDPGYLTIHNLVLASAKEAPHRVLLGGGIFAEVELLWERGAFRPLPWTYPDYRTEEALVFFGEARGRLRRLRREAARPGPPDTAAG